MKDIVHALWIGKKLSLIEQLTLRSYLNKGHQFWLWCYDQLETPIPSDIVQKDANDIIPRNKVFSYTNTNQFGHGKGSYAGFSDIFRYKLLYEYGGWWTDMDVTCLSPLDFPDEYVFRTHHDLAVVGNVMKCPKNSELMQYCYEQAEATVKADNTDWHKPISILNQGIDKFGLNSNIREFSNPDSWRVVRKFIVSKPDIPPHWKVIHWINEEWRRLGISKNQAIPNTLFSELLFENGLSPAELKLTEKLNYRIRASYFYSAFKQLPALLKKHFG